MTVATIPAVDLDLNLDETPTCSEHTDIPAVVTMKIIHCGCSVLMCDGCLSQLIARNQLGPLPWSCGLCGQFAGRERALDLVIVTPL